MHRRSDPRAEARAPLEAGRPVLSVVAPVFDEELNLGPFHGRIRTALEGFVAWELLLVDDGSNDGSARIIAELQEGDPRVRGIFLRKHSGQSSAICAGIQRARGSFVATIDADLQNDPADLRGMLGALADHDAVVGFREKRNDSALRRASSWIANRTRNAVTGDSIRDTGCSLKVFKRQAIRAIPFFEGMHRFLPTLLRYHGFSVIEVPVTHHPRVAGRSKYGVWNRALPAFEDLLAVRWMRSRIVMTDAVETAHEDPARR